MTDVNALMKCKTTVRDMRMKKIEEFKDVLDKNDAADNLFITAAGTALSLTTKLGPPSRTALSLTTKLVPQGRTASVLSETKLVPQGRTASVLSETKLVPQGRTPAVFHQLFGAEGLLNSVAGIAGVNSPDFLTGYYFARVYMPKIAAILQIENETQLLSLHCGFNAAADLIDGMNVFLRRGSAYLQHVIRGIDKVIDQKKKLFYTDASCVVDLARPNDYLLLRKTLNALYSKKIYLFTCDINFTEIINIYFVLLIAFEFVERRGVILLRADHANEHLINFLRGNYARVEIYCPPWCAKTYICLSERTKVFSHVDAMSYLQKMRRGTLVAADKLIAADNPVGTASVSEGTDLVSEGYAGQFTEDSAYEFVLSMFESM